MASGRTASTQYAALPYRIGSSGLEVLLITSRGTGRWIIPKGWPIAGLTSSQSAVREAWEEAGVTGHVAAEGIGSFGYDKRLADDTTRYCDVEVFALEVTEELDVWPEQHERQREWFSFEEACKRVSEAAVGALIQELRERLATRR